MNKSRDRIRALWCRQLAGEPLLDAEHQLIRDALREDPGLVAELSSDATSHALLKSLDEVIQTEDDFVKAALQKATSVPTTSNSAPPTAAGQAVPTMPATGLPLVVDAPVGSNREKARRRRSPQWLALSLTLILFLSVGLMFWLQGRGQSELATTGQPPTQEGVDQGPELFPQDEGTQTPGKQYMAATDDVNAGGDDVPETPDTAPNRLATNDNEDPTRSADSVPDPRPPMMLEETPPASEKRQFVTLTKAKDPVWERTRAVGSRLGDEAVKLFGGSIELTFDDGAVVTLKGPVEFQPRAAGQLTLHRGQLSAAVPRKAIGFTVLTPTSEVVDLGTEFEVYVRETGASDVRVRKGEIEVAASRQDRKNIRKWKLVPRGLNRASFYARPDDKNLGPIAAKVQGAKGQFHGIISLDGKTAEFRSASTFNDVHERVLTQLKTSHEDTLRQWQEFVDSMQTQMRGSMNFNGRQMQFGSFDEVMRLHNQLQNQANSNAGSQFSGSININGKEIQFKSRAEFEAARKAAFGAAANFGAGDFLNRLRPPR